MKKTLLFVGLAFTFLTMSAQNGFKVGVGFGVPTGDTSDFSSFSLGFDISYYAEVSDYFDVGITTGFINAFSKNEVLGFEVEIEDVQFLPIAAAARVNVSDKIFFGTDLGYAIGMNEGNKGGFYYKPNVGYYITERLEASLVYTGISLDGGSWSAIGLGLAIKL